MDQAQNGANAIKPGLDEDKKLFVGGLTLETTEKEIENYFVKYGPIQSVTLKMNPQTGKSKGFAFVVFNSPETVEQVLAQKEHTINNKQVDAKKAKAKPGKIFVGGITAELTDEDIKTYFSQFGNITQVEMPFDKTKNQRKGFCFITFENDAIVKDLLKKPKQTIKDKQVDVKKAATQPNNMMGRGGWGGRGGRGGGRGGQGGWGGGWGGQGGWNDYGYAGYDNGYSGGYDYYGGGYGGGYGMESSYGGTGGGNYGGGRGGTGRGGRGGGRGGQRHQPY
ncbi:RNA-binding protein squid-like [Sitophilus oryzae]|uniref:RNA-binding protein squid-like n=1 Tax=Sitophilus oryzae TaxID=7048 RepID=A0A6J2YMA8_SITOR|nr:RNA-binding protein squid-like [Sitophilus oryzae]